MQEITLSSKPTIKVVFDGQEYMVKKPSIAQVRVLEKQLDDPSKDVKSEATLNFIAGCGLPREVLEQMDLDGMNAISEALMPKKKA